MNDVFISYAHIDDQALTEGKKGGSLLKSWLRGQDLNL